MLKKTAQTASSFSSRTLTGFLFVGFGSALLIASLVLVLVADSTAHFHLSLSSDSAPLATGRSLLNSKADAAKQSRETARSLPRYDFSGQPVSNEFKPDDQKYLESIAVIAAVGFIIAIVSLFFGLFFCAGRKCCGCCGGTVASQGCCCPAKDEFGEVMPRFYTKCERTWVRLAMLVTFGCVVGLAIVGYVGNADFHTAVGAVFDTAVDTLQGVSDDVTDFGTKTDQIVDDFVAAGVPGVTSAMKATDAVNSLSSAIGDVNKELKDLKDQMTSYDDYRVIALIAIYAFCVFICLFGGLGALFGCAWPACITAVFGFFVLLLVFVMFGIHFPISVLFADMCTSVDTYISDRTKCENMNSALIDDGKVPVDCTESQYTPNGQYLNKIVKCLGTDQRDQLVNYQWKNIRASLYLGGDSAATQGTPSAPLVGTIRFFFKNCAGTSTSSPNWDTTTCDASKYQWVGQYRTDSLDDATLVKGTGTTGEFIDVWQDGVFNDVVDCIGNSARTLPGGVVTCASKKTTFKKILAAYDGLGALTPDIFDLTSCLYVLTIFEKIFEKVCVDMSEAIDMITASFGSIGFVYFFAVFFCILGLKRFAKQEDAGVPGGAIALKPLPMKNMAHA